MLLSQRAKPDVALWTTSLLFGWNQVVADRQSINEQMRTPAIEAT